MSRVKLLVFAAAVATSAGAQRLELSIAKAGSFAISMDGRPWLRGGETQAGGLSSSALAREEKLLPSAPIRSDGEDELGHYNRTSIEWRGVGNGRAIMTTSFRTYTSDPSTIVFEQLFPAGLDGAGVLLDDADRAMALDVTARRNGATTGARLASHASTGKVNAQSIFPGFTRDTDADAKDCFAYHGVFPQMEHCTTATYHDSHMGGVPLVIYDSKDTSLPMTVFSPLNQPMASHMASGLSFFGAGVKSTVTRIPAGWSQLFILTAGTGINSGMMAWGDRMLKYTGKPRANMYKDLTHSTIGFWTDNGGYYHYKTGEPNCKPGDCPSYETVLPKVKAYHDSIGVPFRHWQFDSWFYPKDGGVTSSGGGGAVTNWTADPKIFPSGMVAIQQKLDLPIVMHNRQWSTHSDYIKTGCMRSANREPPEKSARADSEYCEWYNSSKAAVPADPTNFFTWFFTQQDGWGLSMYEQDWMSTEYDDVDVLQTNISMGDLWLQGMATGAQSSNRSVQFCMPYANQVLSAASLPAVTNARATEDYLHAIHQWAIGGTSLFYWAIGILPFKVEPPCPPNSLNQECDTHTYALR